MDIILTLAAKKQTEVQELPVQRMWEDEICAIWEFTQRRNAGPCRRFGKILGPVVRVLTVQELNDH